jgi:hypothetical protein
MKRRFSVIFGVGFLVLVLGAGIVWANADSIWASSPNYAIPWDVVSGGGNEMGSTNYAIKSTNGQTIIGPGSSNNYSIGVGYWYGVGERFFSIYLPLIVKSLIP